MFLQGLVPARVCGESMYEYRYNQPENPAGELPEHSHFRRLDRDLHAIAARVDRGG
jgi:hypothetical protein